MKTTNFKNITGQAAAKGSTPRLPGASSRAYRGKLKQITEQLELALDMPYQLALNVKRATKLVAKEIPNLPYALQLCLNFDGKVLKRRKWSKFAILAAGSAGILIGLSIALAIA